MTFSLKFEKNYRTINELAERYSYPNEGTVSDQIAPKVRDKGFYTKEEFIAVGYWKSPRNQHLHIQNHEGFIYSKENQATVASSAVMGES